MNRKQKAAAAAMAVVAAAGMVTATVVESPAELLEDPAPVTDVQQVDDEGTAAQEEKKVRSPAGRMRAWILQLPAAVRMLVGVPLWMTGWVLLTALSTFWMGVTAPVVSRLLGWLCLAIVILAVFAVSVKAAFPQLPLREIFSLRNLLLLLGAVAVLAMADMALPTVWEGYDRISQTVWRVGSTCLLACCCCTELKRQGKRAEKLAHKASCRTEVEEAALALADTVCPPRF